MVTKAEFLAGLLEPLPAAMAPLAIADMPGAVVRGMGAGQPFSEAFGSVMADPTSMEGRVYGEDVTGDPYSGMIYELLTDPAMWLGAGVAGMGGLGMALSRRYARGAGSEAAENIMERLAREGLLDESGEVNEAMLRQLWHGTEPERELAQEIELALAGEAAEGTVGHRLTETASAPAAGRHLEAPGELPPMYYRLMDELMRITEKDPGRVLSRGDIYSPIDLSLEGMGEKQIRRLRSTPSTQIKEGLFLPPGGGEGGEFVRSQLIAELLAKEGGAGIESPLGEASKEVKHLLMPFLKERVEDIGPGGIPISQLTREYAETLPEHAYQYYRNPSDVPFPGRQEGSLGGSKYGYYPFTEPTDFPYGAREVITHRKLRPGESGLDVGQAHESWPSPTEEEGMSYVSHWRGGELPVSHGGTTKNTLHFTETQSGETIKGLERDLSGLSQEERVVQKYQNILRQGADDPEAMGNALRRAIASGAEYQNSLYDPYIETWLKKFQLPPEAGLHERGEFYEAMKAAARSLNFKFRQGINNHTVNSDDLYAHLQKTALGAEGVPEGSFVNQAGEIVTPMLRSTDPENQHNILTSLFQVAQDPSLSGLSHSGAREVRLSVGLDPRKGRQIYGEVPAGGEIEGKVGKTIDELQHIIDVYEGNISDRELMAMQASGEMPTEFSEFTKRVARERHIDLGAMTEPELGRPEPMGEYDLTLDEVLEGVEPESIAGLKDDIARLTKQAETEPHRGDIEKYLKRVTGVDPAEVYPRSGVQQEGYGDPVKYYPLRTEGGEWVSPKVASLMEMLLKRGVPIVPALLPVMMAEGRRE